MNKRLLYAAVLMSAALNASAVNVGDLVYTNHGRYRISGENLLKNSNFAALDGWSSINDNTIETSYAINPGGGTAGDLNSLKASASSKDGLYQAISVEDAGTYVLTMKIKNETASGFSDNSSATTGGVVGVDGADFYSAGQNYINLIYNQDGTPGGNTARADLTSTQDEVEITSEYTQKAWAINVTEPGFVIAEIAALAEGCEVTEVELRKAVSVYDDRLAQNLLDYANCIMAAYPWDNGDFSYVEDLNGAISSLDAAIKANDGVQTAYNNLNSTLDIFLGENTDEMLQYWGSGNTSANWDNWNKKVNKLNSESTYKNIGWTWTTDRWHHKGSAANNPMGIQWMGGSAADWDNIATYAHALEKGTYIYKVEGSAARMTLNKNDWRRLGALQCAQLELQANGETKATFNMNTVNNNTKYYMSFTLDADKEDASFGMRCNPTTEVAAGFDATLYHPVLYKVYTGEGLTEAQKAFLANVSAQMEEAKKRLDDANDLYANDKTRPWGKAELKAGIDEIQALYDNYAKMSEDYMFETYLDNDIDLSNEIYTTVGKPIKDTYVAAYNTTNQPIVDLKTSIDLANDTKALRLYETASGHAAFASAIAAANEAYEKAFTQEYSEENSQAVTDANTALKEAIDAFKATVAETVIAEFSFGSADAPASIVTVPAADEMSSDTYYILGDDGKTKMDLSNVTGSQPFELGVNSELTDMLRVGNGTGTVNFEGAPAGENDIVKISFDLYVGNLAGKSNGFYVQTADGTTVGSLYFSKYSGTADDNVYGFTGSDVSKINGVGSSSASNAAIGAESNKSHFDVVFDYGAGTTSLTINSKSTFTSEQVPFDKSLKVAKFILQSNYNNSDRRSFFDNLKISNVKANKVETGISDVKADEAKNGAIYNVAGQRIAAPAKGQIYIQNGKKYLAK